MRLFVMRKSLHKPSISLQDVSNFGSLVKMEPIHAVSSAAPNSSTGLLAPSTSASAVEMKPIKDKDGDGSMSSESDDAPAATLFGGPAPAARFERYERPHLLTHQELVRKYPHRYQSVRIQVVFISPIVFFFSLIVLVPQCHFALTLSPCRFMNPHQKTTSNGLRYMKHTLVGSWLVRSCRSSIGNPSLWFVWVWQRSLSASSVSGIPICRCRYLRRALSFRSRSPSRTPRADANVCCSILPRSKPQ